MCTRRGALQVVLVLGFDFPEVAVSSAWMDRRSLRLRPTQRGRRVGGQSRPVWSGRPRCRRASTSPRAGFRSRSHPGRDDDMNAGSAPMPAAHTHQFHDSIPNGALLIAPPDPGPRRTRRRPRASSLLHDGTLSAASMNDTSEPPSSVVSAQNPVSVKPWQLRTDQPTTTELADPPSNEPRTDPDRPDPVRARRTPASARGTAAQQSPRSKSRPAIPAIRSA